MEFIRKCLSNKLIKILPAALLCASVCFVLAGCDQDTKTESENENVRYFFAMDTSMSVTAYGGNWEEALDACEEKINELDELFSTGIENSEISLLNESKTMTVSDETYELIRYSGEISAMTDGAFDITIYPVVELWGFYSGEYYVPGNKELSKLIDNVDYNKVELLSGNVVSIGEDQKIDLGGIAKGYASKVIMEIFEEYEIQSGMAYLGGNVSLYGTRTDGEDWRVGIADPLNESSYIAVVEASDMAVITSGSYNRYFEEDGEIYHHIIDPDTGMPADNGLLGVTIVCDDDVLADGLSTALFVMGKDKAIDFWRSHQVEFEMIIEDEDEVLYVTEGLRDCFSTEYEYNFISAD